MHAAKVWKVSWYMLHYGGNTPKRHIGYSNSSEIGKLWMGRLIGWKASDADPNYKTTNQSVMACGKKTYTGTKKLKMTQPLTSMMSDIFYMCWVVLYMS
jgi:hypothetical protein